MPYMLASQMQDQPPAQGGGLVDYLRRFVQPRSVLDVIDQYQYGPRPPSGPQRPYVTQRGATPLARVASDPGAVPGVPALPRVTPHEFPDELTPPPRMTNPAVAAIRDGANAARAQAAEMPALGEPGAPGDPSGDFADDADIDPSLLQTGKAIAEASAQPTVLDQMLQNLVGRAQASDSDKWMALAKGGFGMAASRQPTFFGALGEGGLTGLDAFQRSQNRATEAAAQAARLSLTDRARAEQERHNKATEDYRGKRLKIDERQANDLKAYREAVAGQGRYSVAGQTPEGFPVLFDSKTGEEKVLGTKVSVLKGASGGNSVFQQKLAALQAAGYDQKTATDIATGRRQVTPQEAIQRATAAARAKAALETSPARQREVYDETYNAIYSGLLGGAPAAPGAAPPPAAPGAIPARPQGVPQGAKYSPSQKTYWWQEGGQWKSAPAE